MRLTNTISSSAQLAADKAAAQYLRDVFDEFVARHWINRSNLIAYDEGVSDGFRATALGIFRRCSYGDGSRRNQWSDGFRHGAALGE